MLYIWTNTQYQISVLHKMLKPFLRLLINLNIKVAVDINN